MNNMNQYFENFDLFFREYFNSIYILNIKYSDYDTIFLQSKNLFLHCSCMLLKFLEETQNINKSEIVKFVKGTNEMLTDKFSDIETKFKREKFNKKNQFFVEPVTYAIGSKWEHYSKTGYPELVQKTFQYVPIIETIKALFLSPEFRDIYFSYNERENNNVCMHNRVFENFCCGEKCKKTEIFHDEKYVIQLQLFADTVNLCNPLQSKANVHKTVAVYLQIRNMPDRYSSRLSNIYLVALCNENDVKRLSNDYILIHILDELKILETEGINIGENIILRGVLINCVFDNLGANQFYGFTESFAHDFFCRICKCTKIESETMTQEDKRKIRQKADYLAEIEKIQNVEEDIQPTKYSGYKRYCMLNDLQYFHMLENYTIDIMHDINEGCIPFLLKDIFICCLSSGITLDQLKTKIISCKYGVLFKKNRPSKLLLEKHNLGQNASQLHCLMLFLPFILMEWYDLLSDVWDCIIELLSIMEIIYSYCIPEDSIKQLEKKIEHFLENTKHFSNGKLKPKQHILTHYPTVIRTMGPPIHYWAMRLESKHTNFTTTAKRTKNFKNINKTLAYRHQIQLSLKGFDYKDHLESSKIFCLIQKHLRDPDYYLKYNAVIEQNFLTTRDVYTVSFLNYNGIHYEKELLVTYATKLFGIIEILYFNGSYYFLVEENIVEKYNKKCNSILIKKALNTVPIIIQFENLLINTSYQTYELNGSLNVLIENLELSSILGLIRE